MDDKPNQDNKKALEKIGKVVHEFWTGIQRDDTHCPLCHQILMRDPEHPRLASCPNCGLAMTLPERSN
jgi:uncharacterized paraquat-inducible protein A